MANPISLNAPLALPPINVPVATEGSLTWSAPWYAVLLSLYQRTGGASGADIGSVQKTADNALTAAGNAAQLATTADTLAKSVSGTATTALSTANNTAAALATIYSLIEAIQKAALIAGNDLSDLGDLNAARANLGVATIGLPFYFADQPTVSQTVFLPLVRPLALPANFAGMATWCGTVATANASFTVQYIRQQVVTQIGTLTLTKQNQRNSGVSSAVTLLAGDVLVLVAPSTQDATLADVAITLAAALA